MEKQHLGPIKKLKIKSKERRQKIKTLVIKRKDDFLTALEKNWRDWALKPVTGILWRLGVTANRITYVGFAAIAAAIWMHFSGVNFVWQFATLIFAAITDAVDGPTARNNDNVTILGTWLDHTRDGILVAWATFLIYKFSLIDAQFLIILWTLQLVLIWITLKDFLVRYLQGLRAVEEKVLLEKFSLDNLQASLTGRVQFFCWTVGYGFLLGSLLLPIPYALSIGEIFVTLAIIFSALNILEAYQKSI